MVGGLRRWRLWLRSEGRGSGIWGIGSEREKGMEGRRRHRKGEGGMDLLWRGGRRGRCMWAMWSVRGEVRCKTWQV